MSVIGLLQKVVGLQRGRGGPTTPAARSLSPELLTEITGKHEAPGATTEAADHTAPICIGIRATIRAALPDSPQVPVLLRQISSLGVEMLVDGPLPSGEQFWLYIPKANDESDHVAIWCLVLACETGGFEESAYVATGTFVEGAPPALPQDALTEEEAARLMEGDARSAGESAPHPRPGSTLFAATPEEEKKDEKTEETEAVVSLTEEPEEEVAKPAKAATQPTKEAAAPVWTEVPMEPLKTEQKAAEPPAVPATQAVSASLPGQAPAKVEAPVIEAIKAAPAEVRHETPAPPSIKPAALKIAPVQSTDLTAQEVRRMDRTIKAQAAFFNRLRKQWDENKLVANAALRDELMAMQESIESLRMRMAAEEQARRRKPRKPRRRRRERRRRPRNAPRQRRRRRRRGRIARARASTTAG